MAIKYSGRNGLIYASPDATSAPVLVGGMRAFTLDLSTDKIDTTEFGATNKTEVLGFPAARGTLEGFWAADDNSLRTAANSLSGTNIALYPMSAMMNRYFGGPAWIDYGLRTAVDQAIGLTGSWTARGNMINAL